jgi:hypothetical protein
LSSSADPIAAYDLKARALAERYETIAAADVHAPLVDLVPRGPELALDIGAGSGHGVACLVGTRCRSRRARCRDACDASARDGKILLKNTNWKGPAR